MTENKHHVPVSLPDDDIVHFTTKKIYPDEKVTLIYYTIGSRGTIQCQTEKIL